jgi:hypothetical protein
MDAMMPDGVAFAETGARRPPLDPRRLRQCAPLPFHGSDLRYAGIQRQMAKLRRFFDSRPSPRIA